MITIPFVFLVLSFFFQWLWDRSRKPVNNNPVIFKDGGSQLLLFGSAGSMLLFAVSFAVIAISGQ